MRRSGVLRPFGQWPRQRWRAAVLALLALVVLVAGGRAPAIAADVFTVSHVKVDVTAADAAQAKLQAIEEAQVMAFRRLVERLTLAGSENLLPEFRATDVARIMAGMTVENERSGPQRYIATLTISFLPDIVRNLFYQYNVPYTEEQSEPFLLLPVWQTAEGFILWDGDGENPWRDAWLARNHEHALTPILLPIGDLTDMSAISGAEAIDGDAIKLQAIALRYGVEHVVVALGQLTESGAIATRLRGSTPFGTLDFSRTLGQSGADIETSAEIAADQLVALLEDAWKNQRAQVTQPVVGQNAITVAIPFDSLAEWNQIRGRIQQTYGVGDVEIDSLSARGGIVKIRYDGTLQDFSDQLRTSGLLLSDVGGTWVIQPRY